MDDEEEFVTILSRRIEARGVGVDKAMSGPEALRCVEGEEGYDAVFLDLAMPEMDGITAVIKLREREQQTGQHQWVVAMTAHAMSGDRERFFEAGMDDYLIKPFKPDDLYAAVERETDSAPTSVAPVVRS